MAKRRAQKTKGDFLEDVVALLHTAPDTKVRTRVRVPVVGESSESREIDVLLSGMGLGYELKRAIECKNWSKRVGVGAIEEFLGKLKDIGIPAPLCAFVAANGFTKGAIRRGAKEGLRLFTVSGLGRDRLSSVEEAAFQYLVYLVPKVELVQQFNDRSGESQVIKCLRYIDQQTGRTHYALDNLWKKWVTGEVPRTLGLHHLEFEIPQDPSLFRNGEESEPKVIFFGLRVLAAVVKIPGAATNHGLKDVRTGKVEKRRLQAQFKDGPAAMTLLENDGELQRHLQHEQAAAKWVLYGIPLPRIIYFQTYWPPTFESLIRAKEQYNQGQKPTFESVEGRDLSRAWSFLADESVVDQIPDEISFKLYPSTE